MGIIVKVPDGANMTKTIFKNYTIEIFTDWIIIIVSLIYAVLSIIGMEIVEKKKYDNYIMNIFRFIMFYSLIIIFTHNIVKRITIKNINNGLSDIKKIEKSISNLELFRSIMLVLSNISGFLLIYTANYFSKKV